MPRLLPRSPWSQTRSKTNADLPPQLQERVANPWCSFDPHDTTKTDANPLATGEPPTDAGKHDNGKTLPEKAEGAKRCSNRHPKKRTIISMLATALSALGGSTTFIENTAPMNDLQATIKNAGTLVMATMEHAFTSPNH
jgi:hypothetical protein